MKILDLFLNKAVSSDIFFYMFKIGLPYFHLVILVCEKEGERGEGEAGSFLYQLNCHCLNLSDGTFIIQGRNEPMEMEDGKRKSNTDSA